MDGAQIGSAWALTSNIFVCRFIDALNDTSTLFRLLGDPTRLRLLRVLTQARCNVSELTAILAVAQSGVSRHLGLLRDAGLVAEERDGGYAYFRLARDGSPGLWPLLDDHFVAAESDALVCEDEARLQEVLRLRKENFDTHGDARQLVPGRSWVAWARALGHLLPALDVADIGCGDGYLALEAAQWARLVVGIDCSREVLTRARRLAARRRVTNVQWKQGDLSHLPLGDGSVDVALLSHALHHAIEPEAALAEAARVLRPGGRLLVLDLRTHTQTWVTAKFGDRHLGFRPDALDQLLQNAGVSDVRVATGARSAGDPFTVLIASGTKSAA
jgi:SAM-dependent methyltransferase